MPILIKDASIDQLRQKANWIRDDLEPKVLRDGENSLDPNTVLELHELLRFLLTSPLSIEVLRVSRIHKALLLITGVATPWPSKLIDMCDVVLAQWTAKFGKLADISVDLYGPGGRLHGIAEAHEVSRKALESKWLSDSNISPLRALEHGHLGFVPGQWWIHPCFAFHAGIISSPSPYGGITADSEGAYALTLTSADHIESHWPPWNFMYRVRRDDPGRFRLLNSILPVKTPIRVLRSHTLHSLYSPLAGIRYEGLYKIMDWSARSENNNWEFDVTLKREPDQVPMAEILRHPLAEELDDYVEYRRVRELHNPRQVRFQFEIGRAEDEEGERPLEAKGKVVREEVSNSEQLQANPFAAGQAHRRVSSDSKPSPRTLAPLFNDAVLTRRLERNKSRSRDSSDDEESERATTQEYQEASRMKEKRIMNADEHVQLHKHKPGPRGPDGEERSTSRVGESRLSPAHSLPFHPEIELSADQDTYFKVTPWKS